MTIVMNFSFPFYMTGLLAESEHQHIMTCYLSFNNLSCGSGFIPAPEVKEVELFFAEINFEIKIRVADFVFRPIEFEGNRSLFAIEKANSPLCFFKRFNPNFSTVNISIFKCLYSTRILINRDHILISKYTDCERISFMYIISHDKCGCQHTP